MEWTSTATRTLMLAARFVLFALLPLLLPVAGGASECSGFSVCSPTAGTTIPVAGGAVTGGTQLGLSSGGAITGRITEATTGLAIPQVSVRAWDQSGAFVESTRTDSAGRFEIGGLAAGTFFLTSFDSAYRDELYNDLPCDAGGFPGCDPTTGTPIAVMLNSTTAGVDFALERLGTITGRVVDEVTGDPIPDVNLSVWDEAGSFVGSGFTDTFGVYRTGPLAEGTYFLTTDSFSGHLDELYDDLPCHRGGCDPTSGTPVPVALNSTTAGIDFALTRLGSIAGTVLDAATGDPLLAVDIEVWDATGAVVGSISTSSSGFYRVDGLVAGTYFLTTNTSLHSNELYDDLPCTEGSCDPTTGTPIDVALNSTTIGIDFALERLGIIAGTVVEAGSGDPLLNVRINIWDGAGSFIGEASTDGSGFYSVGGIHAGTYFAISSALFHSDELYDDLPCADGCDPATGTPHRGRGQLNDDRGRLRTRAPG